MDPGWNSLQQQMGEENGWNLEAAFGPNMILMPRPFDLQKKPLLETPIK